jgi:hypothetical protein
MVTLITGGKKCVVLVSIDPDLQLSSLDRVKSQTKSVFKTRFL